MSKTVSIGFPQGGVCSAKFLIIAFTRAVEIINSHGAFSNGFADNCVTMMPNKIKEDNKPLEFSTTAKYLGVTLDQKLT